VSTALRRTDAETTPSADLESLYLDHFGWMRRAAAGRLGEAVDDATDIVHEVFVKLLRRGDPVSGVTPAYLAVAIRNQCTSLLRRKARRRRTVMNYATQFRGVFDATATDSARVTTQSDRPAEWYIGKLPERCGQVWQLKAAGSSNRSIAIRLGVSVKAVEAHLAKGRALMRQLRESQRERERERENRLRCIGPVGYCCSYEHDSIPLRQP
jgi:RNA polymerase sigma factor (sigma-70 family)